MPYFKLYPDIKYIKGEKRATLYLLGHSKTIHLSSKETNVINSLISEELDTTIVKFGDIAHKAIEYLLINGLAAIYEKDSFTEGYLPFMPFQIKGYNEPQLMLEILFIQISDECNVGCDFCKNDNYLNYEGCNSCIRWKNTTDGAKINDEKLIQQIEKMDGIQVKEIIFSGGNPFLHWESLIKIIKKLRVYNKGSICVYCPQNTLDIEKAKILKEYNITVILNIFSTTEQGQELNKKLDDTIKILEAYNIQYNFTLILTSNDSINYDKMISKTKLYSPNRISSTELIPLNNSDYKLISQPTGIKRIDDVSMLNFFYRTKYSTCMNKKIAISADGNILPCPSWKKSFGNIFDKHGIRSIFKNDSYVDAWENPKSKVVICENCENKFACVDCSCLDNELKDDPKLLKVICDYDTKNGYWRKETERNDFDWKL